MASPRDTDDGDFPPGERRALTGRLLRIAYRRRGMCAVALFTMLLAGATDSAPILLAKVFVEDILAPKAKAEVVVRPDGTEDVAWRDRKNGDARGVRREADGALRPLTAAELEAAGPTGPSTFARYAYAFGRRIAGDNVDPTMSLLAFAVLAIMVTALLAAVATYANTYVARGLAAHVVSDLRAQMMERLLRAPLAYFSRRKLGDLQSRFANDATLTQHTVDIFVSELLLQPCVIAFGVSAAFYINWRLALSGFIVLPLVVVPLVTLGKRVQKRAQRSLEALGESTESVSQTLSGVRIVKAFAAEDREAARYRAVNEDWRLRALHTIRARALGRAVLDVSYGVILSIVLAAGGWLVASGKWDVGAGEFLALIVALAVVLQPLKRTVNAVHTWAEALAGAKRLFAVVDLAPETPDRPGAKEAGPVRTGIRFEGVSFAYPDTPDQPVLDDVAFDLPAGRTVALVGPSGAGKSTVADLVMRFYEPTRGRITIDGTPLNDVSRASLLRQIAVVSQQPFLFNATIAENVRYGRPDATDAEVRAACAAALVDEFLPQLPRGLDTVVGERGASLSGGQLQRITIARALLKNASVMILDEATSNLDSRSEALVQEAVFNLVKGRTALIIAHRLSTIERADEIVVVEKGRIVERGPHAALLERRGAYWRLRQAQTS